MDLTRTQAIDATKLCLYNTKEYLEDARVLYEKRRLQHIRISFQFALEETGKAKAMIDQLNAGNSIIEMNHAMRKEHQPKIDYIKNLIKVPPEREKYFEDVWSAFPMSFIQMNANHFAKKFVELDQDILNDIIDDAHEKRLRTLVNFDGNTHDAYLDPPMREGDCEIMIEVITKLFNDLTKLSNNIKS